MNFHKSVIVAVALTGFALAAPSMAQDKSVTVEKTTTTTHHHYVYYGDHQIYFAPETKVYYWRSSNGDWVSGNTLPMESQSYIKSGGMEIDLDTDTPYTQDEVVITKYKSRK
jgi:hypothetical protein